MVGGRTQVPVYARDSGRFERNCANGHQWEAVMYEHVGHWWYLDSNMAKCPKCGSPAIEDAEDAEAVASR